MKKRAEEGPRASPLMLNRHEAAELLACTEDSIDKWMRTKGLPVIERGGRGRPWKFYAPDLVQWKIRQVAPPAEVRPERDLEAFEARRRSVQAELAELELARRRGEVASLADIERMMVSDFAAVRARILAAKHKLAPILAPIREPNRIEAILGKELCEALDELARTDDPELARGARRARKRSTSRTAGAPASA